MHSSMYPYKEIFTLPLPQSSKKVLIKKHNCESILPVAFAVNKLKILENK